MSMLARIEVDCNDENHHVSVWESGDETRCGAEHVVQVSGDVFLCYEDHEIEIEETIADLTGANIYTSPCFLLTVTDEYNLTHAATKDDIAWIELLLAIDKTLAQKSSNTPLLRAVGKGNLDIVKLLVEFKARIINGYAERNPVYDAITADQPDILEYLLKNGAKLQGHNMIREIVWRQGSITDQHRERMVRALLSAGADIHAAKEESLKLAILQDQIEFSQFLISQGADIKAIHEKGSYSDILFTACKRKLPVDTIKFILNYSFDNDSIIDAIKVTERETDHFNELSDLRWRNNVLPLLKSYLK